MKKILVMDDSATARALFKVHFIDRPDYEIYEATRVDEALALANQNKLELIVLDYNMPENTGSEVAKLMQENGIKAHFVLLTANTQQSVIDEAKSLGILEVLEKPVSAEAINSLLEKLK